MSAGARTGTRRRLSRGDVVLVHFPFTDLTGQKLRPAVIVGRVRGDDVIVAFMTSRVTGAGTGGGRAELAEHLLEPEDAEFRLTGLKGAGVLRLDKLATLHRPLVRYLAGLAATRAPARRCRRPARRLGRVARRRPRGVAGVLPQPRLEVTDLRRQRDHLLDQHNDDRLRRRMQSQPDVLRQHCLPVGPEWRVHGEHNAPPAPHVVLRSPVDTP